MKRLTRILSIGIAVCLAHTASAAGKLNILFIMGDDVGYWNISAFHQGVMGYDTPNIDRIANDGGKLVSQEPPAKPEA